MKNKKIKLLLYLCFFSVVLYAQTNFEYNPEKLFAESDEYNEKFKQSLISTLQYKSEGNKYLDSIIHYNNLLVVCKDAASKTDYVNKIEGLYVFAYKYIALADSMSIMAQYFSDMALEKAKQGYAQMGLDINDVLKNLNNNVENATVYKANSNATSTVKNEPSKTVKPEKSLSPAIEEELYIIQLGAGNMNINFFNKVPDIVIVQCKDNVQRYVLPQHYTKSEAYAKKEELQKIGYAQVFIRTKESLDKIARVINF